MSNVGKKFLERTKYHHLNVSDQNKGVPQPPLEQNYDKRAPIISLPNPRDLDIDMNLLDAIVGRKTLRRYSSTPLSLKELSYLLWCTQGVKNVHQDTFTSRTVPSAGARHAFETFILVNNVEGMRPGLYRFIASKQAVQKVDTSTNISIQLEGACLNQKMVTASAVTFIWVAVPYRMTWRYSERGYRYLFLDAGHVCQNLYLAAEGIGCGVCAVAAYSDDDVNKLLGIDGENSFVIYIGTVGKK